MDDVFSHTRCPDVPRAAQAPTRTPRRTAQPMRLPRRRIPSLWREKMSRMYLVALTLVASELEVRHARGELCARSAWGNSRELPPVDESSPSKMDSETAPPLAKRAKKDEAPLDTANEEEAQGVVGLGAVLVCIHLSFSPSPHKHTYIWHANCFFLFQHYSLDVRFRTARSSQAMPSYYWLQAAFECASA